MLMLQKLSSNKISGSNLPLGDVSCKVKDSGELAHRLSMLSKSRFGARMPRPKCIRSTRPFLTSLGARFIPLIPCSGTQSHLICTVALLDFKQRNHSTEPRLNSRPLPILPDLLSVRANFE